MNEKTKDTYRSLAANFYQQRVSGPPTPKRLADALKSAAADYQPAYWKKLRAAIAFEQEEAGFSKAAEHIRGTKRPVGDLPPRRRRDKGVSEKDQAQILAHLEERGDRETWAAVTLARWTGARPAEMPGIEVNGDQVSIEGAKKSHEGQRGADRVVTLDDSEALEQVRQAVAILDGVEDIGPIQDRVSAAGRRLWPQRKSVPSLYSWRHQTGSNLKASGLDRRMIAYLMGHQSTESVEVYGRRNRGGKTPLRPAQGADISKVRETHKEPPSVRLKQQEAHEKTIFKGSEDSPKFGFEIPEPRRGRAFGPRRR